MHYRLKIISILQMLTSGLDGKNWGHWSDGCSGNHGGKIEFDQHDCRGNYLAKNYRIHRNLHQAVYRIANYNNVEFKFTSFS